MGRPKGSKNGVKIVRYKTCELCKKEYIANYANYNKVRFCSYSCSNSLKRGRLGKKGSEKQRLSVSSRTGEKHQRWISDRTKIVGRHNRNFHDPEYKQWRKNVYNRDGYKCKINNAECNGKIEAHHILRWKDYPELRYDVNNGITLCHHHHPLKVKEEKDLIPTFQKLLTLT